MDNSSKKYIIPISNGILEKKHCSQIKNSLWVFIWCIDKATKIDKDGIGWVLGGKPMKLDDIEKDLGIPARTLQRDLSNLKKYNYIKIIRAPYGLKIGVCKIQKRYAKSVLSGKMIYTPTGEEIVRKNGKLMAIPKDGGNWKVFTGDFKDVVKR